MCISLFRLVVTRIVGTLYDRGRTKRFKIGKGRHATKKIENHCNRRLYRRDGVVVRASASQLVDLEFISLIESYQKL